MRVFVTGGTGFLGRHLVPRLAQEHDVCLLSRRPASMLDMEIPDGVDVVRGDILDPDSLAPALEGCEAVVHAAGKVSHHPGDAATCWALHVRGTQNVLAAAKAAGVRRFVHVSTSGTIAVTDDAKTISDEDAAEPFQIIKDWPYYRSKLYAEQHALAAHGDGMSVICLNPSLLLGPGDVEGGSVKPIQVFLEGKLPAVPSGGLSFVDARDTAAACASALVRGQGGRRYLLGGANMTFAAFYQRIARISDQPEPMMKMPGFTKTLLGFLPELGRDGFGFGMASDRYEVELASHYWYTDSRRARRELNWTPTDPAQTLRDTVMDIRDRASSYSY